MSENMKITTEKMKETLHLTVHGKGKSSSIRLSHVDVATYNSEYTRIYFKIDEAKEFLDVFKAAIASLEQRIALGEDDDDD